MVEAGLLLVEAGSLLVEACLLLVEAGSLLVEAGWDVQMMKPGSKPPPLVAVDAPSGWHVENGDESGAHNANMLSELLALMLLCFW